MTGSNRTRREFVAQSAAGIGSGWLLLNLPLLTSLAGCARESAERGDPLTNLGAEEARTLHAFVARIIPSDDGTPGATEAGAAYFVDAAIAGPFAAMSEPVRLGLGELERSARAAEDESFADLPTARQDAVIRDFEESELFFPLRFLTVMGVVADPSYGGNREHVGWAMLGMEHAGGYQPPFGHYDAEHQAREREAQDGGAA